jgi:hypothetical protein
MNYTKIVKSAHGKSSYSTLLKQAKKEVEYYKIQVEKYTKIGDLHYLKQAQECLEIAELAVSTFKNKLK